MARARPGRITEDDAEWLYACRRAAAQSLRRRGIDPEQAAREGRRRSFASAFAGYVRARRPSRRFRRLVRALLLAGYGQYPLSYFRPVEYREAASRVRRGRRRRFDAEFLRFWAWAAAIEDLLSPQDFDAQVLALQSFQRPR